jgi:transcriptional regulator with XRE-family HTH domain
MMPGNCLRRVRERLGLRYRDVERSSYEPATRRGRPDSIVRVSRLADIENAGVTPSLYKLYSLCTIYHLDPYTVSEWYGVPLQEHLRDAMEHTAPRTHVLATLQKRPTPVLSAGAFDATETAFLANGEEELPLEAVLLGGQSRYRLGFIGTSDRSMEPLLRPESLVLFDPVRRHIENSGWHNEFDRPFYFVELREGYRCSWCARDGDRLDSRIHFRRAFRKVRSSLRKRKSSGKWREWLCGCLQRRSRSNQGKQHTEIGNEEIAKIGLGAERHKSAEMFEFQPARGDFLGRRAQSHHVPTQVALLKFEGLFQDLAE